MPRQMGRGSVEKTGHVLVAVRQYSYTLACNIITILHNVILDIRPDKTRVTDVCVQ